jgi:hypothetical protein
MEKNRPLVGHLSEEESLDVAYASDLLTALMSVAAPSQRAEVRAALRFGGLSEEPRRLRRALQFLRREGCISHLEPLSDGGLVVTVTSGLTQVQ